MLTIVGSAATGLVFGWLLAHRSAGAAIAGATTAVAGAEALLIAGSAGAAALAGATALAIGAHTLVIDRLRHA